MKEHLLHRSLRFLWKAALPCIGILISGLPAIANNLFVRIVEVEGRVFTRPHPQAPEREISVGDRLASGSFIRPAPRARVRVQCSDSSIPKLVSADELSSVSTLCRDEFRGVIRGDGFLVSAGNLQGGSNAQIPYVITPRLGLLLTTTPPLRWNPIENSHQYTVSLMSDQENIWQIETAETVLPYPTNEPPLIPEVWYTLIITSDSGKISTDEQTASLRFRFFPSAEADAVQKAAQQIIESGVSEQAINVSLANLYSENGFLAEAITKLEDLVTQGYQQPFVYRSLGDLYQRSGLRLLAEERYQQAIALAIAPKHVEQRAAAELGLGLLYKRVGNLEQASHWFNLARTSYIELGEQKAITLIDACASPDKHC